MPPTDAPDIYGSNFSGRGSFQPGQAFQTRVLALARDTVFIELDGKHEGQVARAELLDRDGELTVRVGDPLRVFFLRSQDGDMQFTTRLTAETADPELLEQAFRNQIPLDGTVDKEIKGGYEIRIGTVKAFCPSSQMGPARTDNPETWVGKQLPFRITEFRENGRTLVVSNRVFHEEARQDKVAALKASLKEGQKVSGTVLSLQNFGAFVDLGGVQALLPMSELGRARVEDIRTVLSVGQTVEAVLLKLDWANERLTLSLKSLQADPWDSAAARYPEGSRHQGKVVRVTSFGAFVALEAGLDGLLHVSEFASDGPFGNTEVTVKPGQTVAVQVLSVDRERRRLALKLSASPEDDEARARYLGSADTLETDNPFARLLKKP